MVIKMLVSLDNISVSFGEKVILKDLSATIEDNDRIGLIGANGIGKSTLLNVICGKIRPDKSVYTESAVGITSNTTIGLLEQNSGLFQDNTVYQEMKLVFSELLSVKEKIEFLEQKIADGGQNQEIIDEHSRLQAYFEVQDGYNFEVKIKTILNGMGFMDFSYDTLINTLSGGEKTRLALAKLLLEQPNLLILDEPTNHLDFKTLMWLEDYLKTYKGGLLVVSHDRYFLDKMVTKIWEIENKKIVSYNAGYTKYKELRADRYKREMKAYEIQQNKINSMVEYAKKNIVRASTSNMAKSRLHQLEHIDVIEKPVDVILTPHFNFTFERNPVKDILYVDNLSLRVGDEQKLLCENISFSMKRGEKIALIGPNGIGKSTLLKALVGVAKQQGEIRWGANVSLSYYEQENLTLNKENTAMDELWDRFPKLEPYDIRSKLGQVLITGDNVFKKIGILSGGERARVAFAVMMLECGNTLILDEPTNHLDLQSKEALEESLVAFEGSLIIVSHDRYFLNTIPTKLIEMSEDGIKIYDGNFDFYLNEVKKTETQKLSIATAKPSARAGYRSKQDRAEELRIKQQKKRLEDTIDSLDNEIALLETKIASDEVSTDYEQLGLLCSELEDKKTAHDTAFLELLSMEDEEEN